MFKAAVWRDGRQGPSIENLEAQEIRDDEVLVRIVACGVCHTDLSCISGLVPVQRPIVLGHEGSGIVERIGGKVRKVVPGDHVVLSYLYCGGCPSCRAAKPCYCHSFYPLNFSGLRADGSSALSAGKQSVAGHFFGQSSFATHSVANERNVVKVRKDAPLELLGPLGCGVQTGAGTVMNVLRPNPGEGLLIFGAGGVGLSAVMAAVVRGCSPIVVIEPNAQRRALALELGATAALSAFPAESLAERVAESSPTGILHAVDTSGIPSVLVQAAMILAPRGILVLLTLNASDAMLSLPLALILGKALTIKGVTEGESSAETFIPELIELIMAGRFPLGKLVRYYDFGQLEAALSDQASLRTVKPIVRMNPA